MSTKVWLSLGSNLGDRLGYLKFAVACLKAHPRIRVNKLSSVYLTEPWGVSGQPDYLNAAVEISTDLSPRELLATTRAIEDESGRIRLKQWEPRNLDIDIVVFDGLHIQSADLTVPHPRLSKRMFVLLPLAEIAGDMIIPGLGGLKTLLQNCEHSQKIEKKYTADQWEEGVCDGDHQ
jgi:2-amino-4-hydroxy-6-hydroxymethyldihydropteridine diphosphokinase